MAKRPFKSKVPVRIRAKELANGNQSLYLDTYRDGQRSYETLHLYLIPEKTPIDKKLNAQTMQQAEFVQAQRITELTNNEVGIKNNSSYSKITLVQWLNKFKENKKQSWVGIVNATIGCINSYSGDVTLKNVSADYCRGFANYLQFNHKTRQNKALSQTSVSNYLNCVNCALNDAVRQQLIVVNPFNMLSRNEKVKAPESQRTHLTVEEVQRLQDTPIKNNEVKRAFLFSCVSGLRLSDVRKLKWSDLEVNNGKARLAILQKKTSTPLYLPINELQLQLMGSRGNDSDLVFALPTTNNIELILKKWTTEAGITKHITFHCARHTFAITLMSKGADVYTISKLMGHSNVKTTQVYAKVVDKQKEDTMSLLNDLF